MGIRKYLVGVIAFVLLIWGPIDRSWPMWFLIRVLYIIAVPTASWFVLSWIWKVWRPDKSIENRLTRTLAGATAGVLLVGAILAAQTNQHYECTQVVRSIDGYECVGDYVLVQGGDWGKAIILIIATGFAFWYGVRYDDSNTNGDA